MKSKMHHNRLHSTPYFHYYSWNQSKYLYILKTFKTFDSDIKILNIAHDVLICTNCFQSVSFQLTLKINYMIMCKN